MIFLSIINHGHDKILIDNEELTKIAKYFTIVIKSNTTATPELKDHCRKNSIQLLDESYGLGFGTNNNYIYSYLKKSDQIKENDYFLVINPDVTIKIEELKKLQNTVCGLDAEIFTVNLYKDLKLTVPEPSIKRFPTLAGPLKGLFKSENRSDAYSKVDITKPTVIDWAAGSFLLFKKNTYEALNGFDEKYFMYFEDVDICRRAYFNNFKILYLPKIKAYHRGSYSNRRVLSKHFFWYLKSYIKYHLKK